MKKICVLFLAILGWSVSVNAGYEADANGKTMYDRLGQERAKHIFKQLSPSEKKITKEQFENRELSRGERREIRREKKQGTYKTPQEEFKKIDLNGDGVLNEDEMNYYYTRKAYKRYKKED